MYKKILVPLDGSGRAERILSHVEDLAACYGASVLFLEVIEPIPVMIDANESVITMQLDELHGREEEATTYLSARVGEFRQKNITASMRILHGSVIESICDIADSEDVDLIAMASHGRGGLGRMIYGSVAGGLLERVDRPLLFIRSRDH